MPQEDKFNSNARSPRFSTSKAIGFTGGQQPSYQQVSGINTAAPPTSPKPTGATVNPAISQFEAPRVPQPAGLGTTLATGAASAVAGEGVKKLGGMALNAARGMFADKSVGVGANTGGQTGVSGADVVNADNPIPTSDYGSFDPGGDLSSFSDAGATTRSLVPRIGGTASSNAGDSWDYMGATNGGATDWASGAADLGGYGDAASSAADWTSGAADLGGYGDAVGSAGGSIPWVGPLIRASQGDWGGAAGSAIGGTIGSMILPGIGTAIGSWLGGSLGGDCFITEAVMSVGGADSGMELETLRGFRDNILSKTPQGQAMIAEYEAIAPIVVEAVSARPDGVQIFQQIKGQFIDPAVAAVQAGDMQEALQIYAQMISFVTPFAAEAADAGMVGEDPATAGTTLVPAAKMMNQMGDHAAMVGQSAELAGQAMPDEQDMGPETDDDSMMAGGGMMPTGAPMAPQQGGRMMPRPGMQMAQMAGPPNPPIGQTFARRY